MRSRELLRRLDRMKLRDEEEPEMVPDFGALTRVENARFWELFDMLRCEEELTGEEVEEYRLLLSKCPLVKPSEAGKPYAETYEKRQERQALERAFGGTFHDYACECPFIAVPNYANGLNEYRLDVGYMLFEKYGWIVGQRDCSTILPLDAWEPEDRGALIELYQRANPECSALDPAGWKRRRTAAG